MMIRSDHKAIINNPRLTKCKLKYIIGYEQTIKQNRTKNIHINLIHHYLQAMNLMQILNTSYTLNIFWCLKNKNPYEIYQNNGFYEMDVKMQSSLKKQRLLHQQRVVQAVQNLEWRENFPSNYAELDIHGRLEDLAVEANIKGYN